MSIKLVGAVLIIAGSGGVGLQIASAHRREEAGLRQLISALDYMTCELQYRLTPLPELCRYAAAEAGGCVSNVLLSLAKELEAQIAPDAAACMNAAVSIGNRLPHYVKNNLLRLGSSLGRFDLQGQLKGLEAVRQICSHDLESLSRDRDSRLRSYQTLGFCAGCALAILFF